MATSWRDLCGMDEVASFKSACFDDAILVSGVNLILVLAFPFLLYVHKRNQGTSPICTKIHWYLKVGLFGSLFFDALVNFFYQLQGSIVFPLGTEAPEDQPILPPWHVKLPPAAFLLAMSSLLAYGLAIVLVFQYPKTRNMPSYLPTWLVLASVVHVIRWINSVTLEQLSTMQTGAVLLSIHIVVILLLTLEGLLDIWKQLSTPPSSSRAEEEEEGLTQPLLQADTSAAPQQDSVPDAASAENVVDKASWWSLLTFSFLFPLLDLSNKGQVKQEALYPVPHSQDTHRVNDAFVAAWALECEGSKKPSLTRALVHAFFRPFILAAVFKCIYDSLQFVGPQVLNAVITYLDPEMTPSKWVSWLPDHLQGYFIVAVMFVSGLLQTCVLHQYFYRVFNVGMNLRAAIVLAIYRKSLCITSATKQQSNTGLIVNLMSTDATRIQDVTTYLAVLWSAPFQMVLALYFLWEEVGVATFAGFGVMVVTAPINGFIARRLRVLAKAVMSVKDERINKTNEVINAIKLVKCNAWEDIFRDRIMEVRKAELSKLLQYILFRSAIFVFFTAVPLLVSIATFLCYVRLGNTLTAAEAFTALSLFNILRFPLAMLPNVINNLVEANVSLKRIQDFLEGEELDPKAVLHLPHPVPGEPAIVFSGDATFSWNSAGSPQPPNSGSADPRPSLPQVPSNFSISSATSSSQGQCLHGISLAVQAGQLVAVVGPVGCGKSTLLNACIGELTVLQGSVTVRGKIAFVPQTAFIINGSLRDNILFGRPFDRELYSRCLYACCLQSDIDMLAAGDATEIGSGGINLSGGQRQRVSLARALYSQADVYLLDDVLSAVDAHVGADIFQRAILGELKHTTRLLVTHGMQYLAQSHHVLCLQGGMIVDKGTYKELTVKGSSSNLAKVMETYEAELASMDEVQESVPPLMDSLDSRKSLERRTSQDKARTSSDQAPRKSGEGSAPAPAPATSAPAGQLIAAEATGAGELRAGTYTAYTAAAGGWAVLVLIVIMFLSYSLTQITQNAWLSYWSEHREEHTQEWFLNIYIYVGLANLVILLSRNLSYSLAGVRAANVMHEKLLRSVLRAPMSFFHTTPTGRILNRFSQDIYTIDEKVCDTLSSYFAQMLLVLSTVGVVAAATPRFLIVVPVILAFYMYVQNFYVPASREIKRLDSVARSPIYSHFSETLAGSSTIRGYSQEEDFIRENHNRLDAQIRAYFWYITSNRWLAVRLETVGTVIVTCASLLAVGEKGTLAAGLAGLSVTYALNITQSLNWLVRMASDQESQVVSLERVTEYSEMVSEPPLEEPAARPPPGWPHKASIELRNFTMSYRVGLPPVLDNVSCLIKSHEKVGICGRTGAGKSSMMVALMRLADVMEGAIIIDNVNTLTLGLHHVRKAMAIIPQEATLFCGTLRHNLDPLHESEDQALWDALAHVQLYDLVSQTDGGLDSKVVEDGENWSHGQRQLICMARALLKGCRIILLDEATASCDVETDALLQRTIRNIFASCTTLTIAHRMHTIADSDRVMVLAEGKIKEFDTPTKLISTQGSLYRQLIDESKSSS
eukprot:CAMPEP_0196578562 /NCGR_PEP_ID=MMETSP1081-20130531/7432_1 /TAXON_ID=36882 /ORGANISM="Pyramimonas amylifera, Strain CCMP720" /LENGTH=1552 /DNA_ID=CAMNT_0041897827 /DNA_START=34 /DNA_END=4692 /DNA_ORIENTATION=+